MGKENSAVYLCGNGTDPRQTNFDNVRDGGICRCSSVPRQTGTDSIRSKCAWFSRGSKQAGRTRWKWYREHVASHLVTSAVFSVNYEAAVTC